MGLALPLIALLLLSAPAAAAVYTWVDDQGVTHISDDPSALPEAARGRALEGRGALRELWGSGIGAGLERAREPSTGAASLEEERILRLLRGALDDLERGETARAAAALRGVLRLDPRRPEAHWYLALLARQRGHWSRTQAHLEAFLASAGDDLESGRRAARAQLAQLEDERRLADDAGHAGGDIFVGVSHPHFEVHYDAELGRASSGYAEKVLVYLEQAHADVGARLGAVPVEPLGVLFYGKAAYLRAHRHRFSFQTVGFFDGRIHVVSAAHPSGELRALLFHEYTHAVFREQTGSDRPFWLNEGLAELSERASRPQPALTRTERSYLRQHIDTGGWIHLRQLAASFAGLDDEEARVAYLASTAAAAWLEAHTDRQQRRRILVRLGEGASDDAVFREVLGLTTEAIDAAVMGWILAEFAAAPPL